ncbi:MAG: hypothetical protein A4E41_01040 [Methanoregulaceae archaeon PtaU1.Bin066]|nr:MAG: hypothetical protein A4E41_01040 [Methanoregulaceae archaeon PtaU1.Bin066]
MRDQEAARGGGVVHPGPVDRAHLPDGPYPDGIGSRGEEPLRGPGLHTLRYVCQELPVQVDHDVVEICIAGVLPGPADEVRLEGRVRKTSDSFGGSDSRNDDCPLVDHEIVECNHYRFIREGIVMAPCLQHERHFPCRHGVDLAALREHPSIGSFVPPVPLNEGACPHQPQFPVRIACRGEEDRVSKIRRVVIPCGKTIRDPVTCTLDSVSIRNLFNPESHPHAVVLWPGEEVVVDLDIKITPKDVCARIPCIEVVAG